MPLAIGASVLVIPWLCVVWKLTAGTWLASAGSHRKSQVAGMVEEAKPSLSLHALVATSYQHWFAREIGKLTPLFTTSIRWKNQLYYTLLGAAGSDGVVVGRDGQLTELPYIVEYCSRDLAALRTNADGWAAGIRHTQDLLEAHGKLFLYVITPSKVAQHPEIMPAGYVCPAPSKDRQEKLRLYDEILTRHGVRLADTASYLASIRKDYELDFFPRGGTHWNALGAALGAQQVIAALNAQHRSPVLSTLGFTVRTSFTPIGTDRDLLNLMNLRYPDAHYPVPELTYHSVPPAGGCRTIRMTEIGGSFLFVLNGALEKIDCPPEITYWFYWQMRGFHYSNDRSSTLTPDSELRLRSLLESHVVLLEENESNLGSDYAKLVMQDVASLMSTTAAPATHPAGSPPLASQ
jgi:alginate O-acetyltransferase complex protein AlgJ